MGKISRTRKDRDEEADSGNLTSSVDGGGSQRVKTPGTHYLAVNHTPVTRKYLTRQSKAILQSHTPASAPTTKNYCELSHSQVFATPIASSRSVSISCRPWTASRGVTECPQNSETVAEEDWSFPTPEEISKFTSAILKDLNPDEVQEVPPFMSPDPVNNNLPTENTLVGPTMIGTKGEDCVGSPPRSLNITEMAAMINDITSDPDEVDSLINPSLVTVNGYRVKEEFASSLRAIIAKYGDIAEKCPLQGKTSRSTALEMVCCIVLKLERSSFMEITSTLLQSILVDISDLESLGLDVGWLRERVEMISNALRLFKGSASLKEEKTKNSEGIEKKVEAIAMLEQKLSEEKDRLGAMRAERETINEKVAETKSKVKCFLGRSLVEGLL